MNYDVKKMEPFQSLNSANNSNRNAKQKYVASLDKKLVSAKDLCGSFL